MGISNTKLIAVTGLLSTGMFAQQNALAVCYTRKEPTICCAFSKPKSH